MNNNLESLANKAKDTICSKNPFPKLDLNEEFYVCKYGLTDLYPECEKVLREAIDSRKTFDTGWVDCKKEIRSFRIISDGKIMTIQVCSSMDDWPDLMDDALWAATGYEEEKYNNGLTDEQIDELTDYWNESYEMDTSATLEDTIPVSTYETTMEVIERLESETEKQLDEWFEIVKSWVNEIINRPESEE